MIVRRQPRRDAPELPSGEVILDSPPEIPPPAGKAWSQLLMVLPMLAGAGAMALMFSMRSTGPIGYILGGMFGLSALGMVGMGMMNNSGGPSKREMVLKRRQYMRHLALQRKRVQRTANEQRVAMYYRHPDPDSLWSVAASHRLWERRRTDADFGVVRIGVGAQSLATPLVPPATKPLDELEPLCASALRHFVQTYGTIEGLPVAMAINGFARVLFSGEQDAKRSLIRAMVAQLAVHHSPDDLMIAICCDEDSRAEWEWTKWLPHCFHHERLDALGSVRLVAPSVQSIEAMLEDLLAARPRFNIAGPATEITGPHLVVILDGGDVEGSSHLTVDPGVEGVTILDLDRTPPRLLEASTLVLAIDEAGKLESRTKEGENRLGVADRFEVAQSEALARQLAPLRVSMGAVGEQAMSTAMGLAELLAIGDPYEFDVKDYWKPRANRNQLRVPIGIGAEGEAIELDLKESAQDGMGPHGLLIGATGSGKSELLRTLVLALAATHNSETLNFVLVDFKGGATFTKLDRIPHTSAVITNLADELPLVDRMTDAINGELLRRQELLRSAGNYSSLRDYEKARLAGAPLAPMPSLLIICDEFSELLSAKPDFIDMFVQIGRVGRSLGVHLLLASQRLEEGRLRGLDTHLSYRISLRTNSAMESRVVIASPDAYELPRAPGHGYLKFGTEALTRFRAAYVSGVYHRAGEERQRGPEAKAIEVLEYDTQYRAVQVAEEEELAAPEPDPDEGIGETLLDVMVERIEGAGVPAHRVWLPPLDEPPTLDQLLPRLVGTQDRGLAVSNPDLHGRLRAHIGLIDRPLEQRREEMALELSGGNGNVAVVGAPQSGKSTALRTIMTSLALSHTPREVQFYCLDFGGGSLGALRDLPHVGGVFGRSQGSELRRAVAEMNALLDYRERLFGEHGIDSMATYRRRKRAGEFAEDKFGDAFLVIDGWLTIRNEFDDLEAKITDIAARGLTYGVHVMAAATRWMDLRTAIRDLMGTRVELRLGDASDSVLDRRASMRIPADSPGRGITEDKMQMLIGLPRIDGDQDPDTTADGVRDLVSRVASAWQAPPAPRVRMLPDVLPYADLPVAAPQGIALGIGESDLMPVYADMTGESHLILFGDSETGKSAFLRAFADQVARRFDTEEARIIALDYRRSLLGAISEPHLLAYGTSSAMATDMIKEISDVMRSRLPGPDVTPDQLRARSWWRGPELYLIVDDYDLVAAGNPNPMLPIVEFLSQARDVGLHLVMTRRSGGAGRALFEPVLMRLRELSTPGILLSGDRDEGALIGNTRPSQQPPGRGWYVTRKEGARLVQLGYLPPPDL
ncbi:type VII secretion protein EccCa [Blastococcus sp. Marseille-P5729]|uniref:type VII secretion protein EccCa n=1 Tax=Blastococcus sp. Marseille-P5729 TaxID=2086582 RepID=UPI0018FE9993|nr:type VII secretion protein EccCa [Blastococcus sp. Marseille-P5729]